MERLLSSAILAGPFIGEVNWELYRFAPLLIKKKKDKPACKLIVLTRPESFDLYGLYADIFIPLRLKNVDDQKRIGYGLEGFVSSSYDRLIQYFYNKYHDRFNIVEHVYPKIVGWRSRLKWQFSRDDLDFEFRPRNENVRLVAAYLEDQKDDFILFEQSHCIDMPDLISFFDFSLFNQQIDNLHTSELGCAIEFIKRCRAVVGSLENPIPRLALLMRKPVITDEKFSEDDIHLINPLDTPVIQCEDCIEGIDVLYANNIRFEKSGSGRQWGVLNLSKIR
jgi:hypothetical protein